jgi:mRNA-degrading endonuclease RelE of RelBE toxin-antitoxin system
MKVIVKKNIWKEVAKLPQHIRTMSVEQLDKLEAANNLSELDNVNHLQGTDEPYYRLKFNDYRFLFHYDEATQTVNVIRIKHRKDAYKKQNLPWK